jgi:hypothetical protein
VKKGQITIFVIIGVVILTLLLIILYFSGIISTEKIQEEIAENIEIIPKFEFVEEYIDNCLEETVKDGLLMLGNQGGYYNLPDKSSFAFSYESNYYDEQNPYLAFFIDLSPFYFYEGKDLVPSISLIENELSDHIIDNLELCINDFEEFSSFANFTHSKPKVTSSIFKERISVSMDYNVLVERDSYKFNFNSFSKSINFDFYSKYNLVKSIIEEQKKDPDYLPLGYITNLAYENDFTFKVHNKDESEDFFILIFNETLHDLPYIYAFAIKT